MICPSIHGSSGDMGAFLSMTLNPEAEELQKAAAADEDK